MTLEEQIQFCKAEAENIKLKTEPKTFIDITKSLEELNDIKQIAESNKKVSQKEKLLVQKIKEADFNYKMNQCWNYDYLIKIINDLIDICDNQ